MASMRDGLSYVPSPHYPLHPVLGIFRVVGHHGIFWEWRCKVITVLMESSQLAASLLHASCCPGLRGNASLSNADGLPENPLICQGLLLNF